MNKVKAKLEMMDVSAELTGIVILLNALGDREDISTEIENGLFAITQALERLIKEIDAQ